MYFNAFNVNGMATILENERLISLLHSTYARKPIYTTKGNLLYLASSKKLQRLQKYNVQL